VRVHRGLIGNVELIGVRCAAGLIDHRRALFRGIEVDIGKDDLGAAPRERERRFSSDAMHPATRAYCDFLLAVTYSGYPAQTTASWALERTYLESWDSARPGAHPYREFVNRWSTDGFRSYVGDLQSSVDRQLEASVGEQAREAEDAFLWVTHYERGFWDMAMSG
jgi:thiaminase